MSPVSKALVAALGIGVVIAGTVALRSSHTDVPPSPKLTPAQLVEIAPPQKPEPPKVSAPVNDPSDLPPPPDDEPDLEDGNGS